MAHPKEERGLLTDLGFIADLYHRHPLRTPDGETLTEGTAFFLLLRTWVTAQYRLLASLDSRYAHRYLAFVDNLRREYRIRCSETPSVADYWLLRQVDQMRLPDQRQDKSHRKDLALVTAYDALKEVFRPMFRGRSLPESSRVELAKLASDVLGHEIKPEDLPLPGTSTLAEYCLEFRRTSATRLSRARRRLRAYDRRESRMIRREIAAMSK